MMYCPSTSLCLITGYRQYIQRARYIKEITETACSASFLDIHLEFDNSGHLSTKINDERDDINFNIINVPYLRINICSSPAYFTIDSLR